MDKNYRDIVFPKNNENEFIALAPKLGISKLTFCYPLGQYKLAAQKLPKNTSLAIATGCHISSADITKAKSLGCPIVCASNARNLFEIRYPAHAPLIVYELESLENYDSLHYRRSGLNQVLCTLAAQHNIIVGFSFAQLLHAPQFKMPYLLGRMMQNVRFARKYAFQTKLASFAQTPYEMRAYHDLMSLGKCIGMHPLEIMQGLAGDKIK